MLVCWAAGGRGGAADGPARSVRARSHAAPLAAPAVPRWPATECQLTAKHRQKAIPVASEETRSLLIVMWPGCCDRVPPGSRPAAPTATNLSTCRLAQTNYHVYRRYHLRKVSTVIKYVRAHFYFYAVMFVFHDTVGDCNAIAFTLRWTPNKGLPYKYFTKSLPVVILWLKI